MFNVVISGCLHQHFLPQLCYLLPCSPSHLATDQRLWDPVVPEIVLIYCNCQKTQFRKELHINKIMLHFTVKSTVTCPIPFSTWGKSSSSNHHFHLFGCIILILLVLKLNWWSVCTLTSDMEFCTSCSANRV